MIALITIFILLVVIELAYFRIADKFNIIDKPNLRSSHTSITLRGGGIIFLIGMWIYCVFFGFNYPWFMLGLTFIAGVSFIDDVHSVKNSIRLIIHFLSTLLLFYQIGLLQSEYWYIIVIALIVCVGVINAYNFMDGINGITGGYSLAVLTPLMIVNFNEEFIDHNLLIVAIMSLLVFCFFNFRKKAKCFAGDVGAVGIAFIILFALGSVIFKTFDISYIVFLAVYGVDSVLTIVHRIMLHENLGQAHRKHAYQIMANELKIPHTVVSAVYAFLQAVISFGLIFLPVNHYIYAGAVIALLVLAYVAFMKKYYHLHEDYLKSKNI
ncbi:MAG: glycosyltransferase family 4 protein [Salinivirgaceae bacterium]|nr:glycosyltransferase family 4 protein [Salinivirgaceae bacterium]